MTSDKYFRSVELLCPTCGGSQFEHDDHIENDHVTVRCIGCDREMTKEELICDNAESLNEHVEEIRTEATSDFAKRLKNELKKAFRGNKHIKIR